MGFNKKLIDISGAADTDSFEPVIYTGNDTAGHAITTGMRPDLVWIKGRTLASAFRVFDSIRGSNKMLTLNDGTANTTAANTLTSFDATGFTLGDDSGALGVNEVYDFASWSWKAGGAPTATMDGTTITPATGAKMVDGASDTTNWATTSDGQYPFSQTVNSVSKFSITHQQKVSTSSPIQFPHSLGVVPEFVILKIINVVEDWQIYHVASGTGYYMSTNRDNDATGAGANNRQYNPLYSFTTVDSNLIINQWTGAIREYICYAWASVTGVSHFGSYAGSGISTPITGLGFTPSLLIVKSYSGTSNSAWLVIDSVRGADEQLYANLTSVEYSSSGWSFQSGGFTPRGAGNWDNSGTNYLYCAWA